MNGITKLRVVATSTTCNTHPLEDLMVEELCSTVPPKSVLLMLRRAAESKTMTQNMMRP